MVYNAYNIVYDLKNCFEEPSVIDTQLPHEMQVEADDPSGIADAISDATGYLVESFDYH